MAHICSRDDCKPNNVNGPKVNCFKCKKVCFLHCYGFQKHADDFIKIKINEATMIFELESFTFVCPACDSIGLIVSSKPKLNDDVINTQSPSGKTTTTKELNKIFAKLSELKLMKIVQSLVKNSMQLNQFPMKHD